MKKFWRKYHKWVGLFFTFFILMFCFSGIVLNHRKAFSGCEVSRSWLPSGYRYRDWNNGMVKGTLRLPDGDILCYGNAGVWKTDSCFSHFTSFSEGMREGIDHRKVSNLVQLPDGSVWAVGLYDFYRLSEEGKWTLQNSPAGGERLSDITVRGDTLVLMSRSYLYSALPPYDRFEAYRILAPEGYDPKVSLFKTVWNLHSGELFGLPGKLFVDCMAIVISILCVTGVMFTFLKPWIKKRKKKKLEVKGQAKTMKHTLDWHNNLGYWLFIPTLILAMTGMCLRPPLMIPLVMADVPPVPGSTFDSDNAWEDKFRAVRWDDVAGEWLLSTSAGFYSLQNFTEVPCKIDGAPGVSPMGINVFQKNGQGEWLIGSFSGLYRWDRQEGRAQDYFTGQPFKKSFGRPVGIVAVSGFTEDLAAADEVAFEYGEGAVARCLQTPGDGEAVYRKLDLGEMPESMSSQPMSLWNFALELHVGRCYSPFLGPISDLFVFFSGLLLSLLLISGFIITGKRQRKRKNH